jgi:hypothetical protein
VTRTSRCSANQHVWLQTQLEKLHKTFSARVRALRLSERDDTAALSSEASV